MNQILNTIKLKLAEGTSIPSASVSKRWNIDVTTYEVLVDKIAIIDSYIIDNEHQVVLMTVADGEKTNNYFVVYGYEDSFTYTTLEYLGFDFAHFLYLVKEQNIECNRTVVTESYLEEYLFTGEEISIEQLRKYLPKCYKTCCSYKVNEELPPNDTERQLYIIRIIFEHELQSQRLSVLHFDNDTISAYDKVLNNTCKHLPIEDVFLSLLEKKFKFCYLDLFRCLERLFKVSMTHEFAEKLRSTVQKTIIADLIKQHAGHGHQENQIQYLFSLLPTSVTDIVRNAFSGDINVGYIFYNTRNDIVHYQITESSYEKYTDTQWNALFRFCLLAIDILYTEFDNYLNEIPEI